MKIIQAPFRVAITSPIAGKISIVSTQGRIVRSASAGKSETIFWNTKGAAKGLYLLQVQNETQTLRSKVYVH
jgi:hypothetical protein